MKTPCRLTLLLAGLFLLTGCAEEKVHPLAGRVTVAGQTVVPRGPPGVYLVLHPGLPDSDPVTAPLNSDGAFRIGQLPAGTYHATLSDFPRFRDRQKLRAKYKQAENGPVVKVPAEHFVQVDFAR